MMMDLKIEIQHLVEIESVNARDGHAKRIANKVHGMMIFESLGSFREQRTLLWLFHVAFQRHQAILAGLVQKVIQRFKRLQISLFVVLGASEDPADTTRNLLENVKRIGNEDGADGRAADGDQFSRLNKHFEITVLHQVAGHHTAENNDNADNREHE